MNNGKLTIGTQPVKLSLRGGNAKATLVSGLIVYADERNSATVYACPAKDGDLVPGSQIAGYALLNDATGELNHNAPIKRPPAGKVVGKASGAEYAPTAYRLHADEVDHDVWLWAESEGQTVTYVYG